MKLSDCGLSKVMAGGPPAAVCLLVDCEGLRAWKAARLVEYRTALSRVVPAEWQALSDLEKTKVASAVLDALLFAGGVSVPSVVSNAFAVLYGEYGRGQLGENFELREEQLLEKACNWRPEAGTRQFPLVKLSLCFLVLDAKLL